MVALSIFRAAEKHHGKTLTDRHCVCLCPKHLPFFFVALKISLNLRNKYACTDALEVTHPCSCPGMHYKHNMYLLIIYVSTIIYSQPKMNSNASSKTGSYKFFSQSLISCLDRTE